MTEQSTAAAERSAHVERQPRAPVVTWPIVETAAGVWKLRAVVDAERAGWVEGVAAAATEVRAIARRMRDCVAHDPPAEAASTHDVLAKAAVLEQAADALAEMQRKREPTGLEERGA